MEMETGNKKQQGGFMKSKLVMSFYKVAKPASSSGGQYGATYKVEYQKEPSCAVVHKVEYKNPQGRGGGGGALSSRDGYVHGPRGLGGDEHVDTKATSYIFQVKERRRLEEMNIMKEENM
ncbi:OLC1v1028618C1 [Oldenlandia corymbosa var. corymbosa]|uniref:OLC1v1028618C1 n=1 Tax=Oldenlandia corymbosa var. corymbosa TaxID=529605 RepID=A0AAV1CF38_OLDCO|nr:OLC1v1028618C1 [Oldenlandia corymbosa var. corymbosa]